MPKRVAPLNALQLRRINPNPEKTTELVDGAIPGLRLRISPYGLFSWSLNMRSKGRMRRFHVGNGLSLSEARKRAQRLRYEIQNGRDPTEERREERSKSKLGLNEIKTFEDLIDQYYGSGPGSFLKTKAAQSCSLKLVFQTVLNSELIKLKRSTLQLTVDRHKSKVSAARSAAYLNPILRWAERRDLLERGFPLEKPLHPAPKQTVLNFSELAVLIPKFVGQYGLCAKFILLTGVRKSAALALRWEQIDFDNSVWVVPAEILKDTRRYSARIKQQKKDQIIPLSRQAIFLLNEIKNEPGNLSLKPAALSKKLVFSNAKGGILDNWSRWLAEIRTDSGIHDWSLHSLRRTCATMAGELGAAPHVISAMLGHSNIGGQLLAIYNHSSYISEQREFFQKLADQLDLLKTPTQMDQIVTD